MASLTKMNNNHIVSNSSEEEKKKAALKLDVPKQVGPPIKPSFMDYCTDHFRYGSIYKFIEAMKQLSKEIPFDFKYSNLRFEFEIVAYPNDEKILYAIQLYQEPGTFIIEFRRLDGPGLTYRNHVMKVWTALHARGIGPGVSNKAKAPMPSLNDVNGRIHYTKVAEVLEPILKSLAGNVYAQVFGLKALLPTMEALLKAHCNTYNPTLWPVNEKCVFEKVINCCKSNGKVDRLASAVLKHMPFFCYNCNWELGKRAYDLAMQKIKEYQEKDDIEALEVQRNFVTVLKKMVLHFFRKFNDGDFAKIKSLFKMNINAVEKVENLNTLDEYIYDLLLLITLGYEQYLKVKMDQMLKKQLREDSLEQMNSFPRNEATRTRDCELELPKIDRVGKSITMMPHSEKDE